MSSRPALSTLSSNPSHHVTSIHPSPMVPLLLLLLLPLSSSSSSLSASVPVNPPEIYGGFSNSYNNSAILDDKKVIFFWSLHNTSISIAAQSNRRSGYLALGFGDSMINSLVYVAWFDSVDEGRISSYWIDGKTLSSIHPVFENLTDVECRSVNESSVLNSLISLWILYHHHLLFLAMLLIRSCL